MNTDLMVALILLELFLAFVALCAALILFGFTISVSNRVNDCNKTQEKTNNDE